jgi:hypothetical protein
MSKMQMAGASSAQLSGIMGRLGASAAAGGQSVQKLLNTVGAQGQYLFAAQGLTPYVGHEAAFRSSASMSAAFRSGLISPSLMARMGGVEGATQSATAAQIAAYQTPYAGMQAYNAYMGGGETGNVVTNVGNFGGRMAGNTLQNVGRFMMSQTALTSRHIQDRGVFGEMDQIYQIAKMLPNGLNNNGQVDAGVAYMIMTQQMGMTPEMAQAKLAQMHTYNDPKSVEQMMSGVQRGSIDSILKYNQQEGLNKGILTTPYNAVKRGLMRVQDAGANFVGNVNELGGRLGDSLEKAMVGAFMGVDYEAQTNRTLEFDQLGKSTYQQMNIDYENTDLTKSSALVKINEAAKKGNKAAIRFINSKGTEKADALRALVKEGVVSNQYAKSTEASSLLTTAETMGVVDKRLDGNDIKTLENTLGSSINKVLDRGTFADKLEYMDIMQKAGQMVDSGQEVSEEMMQRIADLRGVDRSSLTRTQVDEYIDQYTKTAGNERIFHIAGMKADSLEGLAKDMQGKHMALQSVKIGTAGDLKATRAQMSLQQGYMSERQRIQQMVKEGKIDTKSGFAAINALDNGQTVGKFGDAVDKFAEAVGAMKGDKKGGELPTWWEVATGQKNRVVPSK